LRDQLALTHAQLGNRALERLLDMGTTMYSPRPQRPPRRNDTYFPYNNNTRPDRYRNARGSTAPPVPIARRSRTYLDERVEARARSTRVFYPPPVYPGDARPAPPYENSEVRVNRVLAEFAPRPSTSHSISAHTPSSRAPNIPVRVVTDNGTPFASGSGVRAEIDVPMADGAVAQLVDGITGLVGLGASVRADGAADGDAEEDPDMPVIDFGEVFGGSAEAAQ
jgi:hypothetical protein